MCARRPGRSVMEVALSRGDANGSLKAQLLELARAARFGNDAPGRVVNGRTDATLGNLAPVVGKGHR